jgi:transposase
VGRRCAADPLETADLPSTVDSHVASILFQQKSGKGVAAMLTSEEWMDIKLLAASGASIRSIAEMTGHSRNTVRRVLRQTTPEPFKAPERTSKLEPFKPYLKERYERFGISAVRLLEEITAQGFDGSIFTVRRYLRQFRARKKTAAKATVRFETPPGQQAQGDWTYLGRFPNAAGQLIPVYAFALVLGFSRMLFVDFTTSMKVETLIDCHLKAFDFFGGCTSTILYDNMKQVKLDRTTWNPLFVDFTTYYGITATTHRVRRPRTKGKIERTIGYVKESFLVGRSFADIDDLNAQARHWLDTVANVRIHGTTGRRPVDLFAQESLVAVGSLPRYQVAHRTLRTVDVEGFVRLERSRYSVPPEHVGSVVLVEHSGMTIRIRSGELIIAEHPKASRPGSCLAAPEHVEAMWRQTLERPTQPEPRWQVRFDETVQTTPLERYEEVVS